MDPTVSLVALVDVLEPVLVLEDDLHLVVDLHLEDVLRLVLHLVLVPMRASVIMAEIDLMVVTLEDLHLQPVLSLPTGLQPLVDHPFLAASDPDDQDSMDPLADQAQEADLALLEDLVQEADLDLLVDPDQEEDLHPLADLALVVVMAAQDLGAGLAGQVPLVLPLPDLVKILVEDVETVASRAPNPVLVVLVPMALLQLTGRTPKDRPCSINSKVPTGTNSVREDSGTSTTQSGQRSANVLVSLGIQQIVTNSTSATGTNGWKNTPSMCSLAPSF